MKCLEVEGRLSEYIDGALAPRDVSDVEAHLDTCSECTRQLVDLRRTLTLLHAQEPLPVPPELRAALRARIRSLPAPRPLPIWRRLGPVQVGVPAAVAAAIVGMAIFAAQPPRLASPQALPPSGISQTASPTPSPNPNVTPVTPGNSDGGVTSSNPPSAANNDHPSPPTSTVPGTGSNKGSGPGPTSLPLNTPSSNLASGTLIPTEKPVTAPIQPHAIRDAKLTLKVTDLKATADALQVWAAAHNVHYSTAKAEDGSPVVTLTGSADGWQGALEYVQGLGKVVQLTDNQAVNATETYRNWVDSYNRAVAREQEYAAKLQNTTDAATQPFFTKALAQAQTDAANAKSRMQDLDDENAMGTVEVTLVSATASRSAPPAGPS